MTLAFHRLVLVSLASLLLAGSADASSTTTSKGAITKLDGGACTITLSDNSTYQFGNSCNFSKLKLGEQIAIVWKHAGNARVAVQVFVAM